MKLAEQIATLKSNIKSKQDQIIEKSGGAISKGVTPDEATEAEIKGLDAEIEVLKGNLERLEGIEKSQAAWANGTTPVAGNTAKDGLDSTQGKPPVVQTESNLPKGIGFALMVKAMAVAAHSKGAVNAIQVLDSWKAPEIVKNAVSQKALIGTTTNADFGAALVDFQNLTGEFIELLRGQTAVDKLAPQMREVPFNVKMPAQTGAVSVGWVGETKRKPTTNPTFGSVNLTKSKVAGIVLLSDELMRFSSPKADGIILNDFVKSTAEFIDNDFFDPTKAESEDSPASVLDGSTKIDSSGVTAAAIEADLEKVIKVLTDNNIPLEGASWVMSASRAANLSNMRDAIGRKYFESMNIKGEKELMTLPVEISAGVTNKIVLVVPGEILLADDGGMDFAISTEATINMGTDQAPAWVNLFEQNLMAIRAERFIRWKKRRVHAAAYLQFA
ncbi:phage major capsid protein [Acinetobacter sp. CFCC 10889]|uniref:phage major capsid protein n=1 Tax=Acinetobacter sp. CFCC 10889 TaxID=1775557 RepID=UPI000DD0CA8F|nr:phage major capsid protein [Acinetobacter sp. CFCC 10889]